MFDVHQGHVAYREGLFARALGRSCDSQPYPEQSKDAALWIQGWWLLPEAAETTFLEQELEYDAAAGLALFQLDPRFDDLSPLSPRRDTPRASAISLWAQTRYAARYVGVGALLAATSFTQGNRVKELFGDELCEMVVIPCG